jgi:phage/plasmid-associated DNA primase
MSAALYADWKNWAEANGEFAGSIKRFSENLTNRGFEQWRSKTARQFRGLRLQDRSVDTGEIEF